MRNIIFIAPPAAGKGTISDLLVKSYNYEHISTGDLLREEIKKGSDLGKKLDEIIKQGKLVNDEFMINLMENKLNSLDTNKSFILDGFPRTLEQAKKLDEMLVSNKVTNNLVVYLNISLEEALKRVMGRVICPNCKRSYNLNNEELKPKVDNICDDCKVGLEHRSDDNEETFKTRFQNYLENTSPILDYYKDKRILISIDAMDTLDNIIAEIKIEAEK